MFFKEEGHKYTYKGKLVPISTTGFISKFKEPFDREFWLIKTSVKENIPVEILDKNWDYIAKYGTLRGSLTHLSIEHYIENNIFKYEVPKEIHKKDVQKFKASVDTCISHGKKFVEDYYFNGEYTLLAKEYTVGLIENDECLLAGKIDNISQDKEGKIFLFDYKTDKKFEKSSKYNKKFLAPFEYLDDCELSKHSLQLAIYKLLFEQQTGLTVEGCKIVWLNDANPSYQVVPVQTIPLTYDLLRNCIKSTDSFR